MGRGYAGGPRAEAPRAGRLYGIKPQVFPVDGDISPWFMLYWSGKQLGTEKWSGGQLIMDTLIDLYMEDLNKEKKKSKNTTKRKFDQVHVRGKLLSIFKYLIFTKIIC